MGAATATRTNPAALWAALLALLLALVMSPLLIVVLATSIDGADQGGPVADIPPGYLALYRAAGARYRLDWAVLAALGKIETDHGRSPAPGVHAGVNFAGCCAGPMQFNIKDGTWAAYGDGDVYNPTDAIPAAARKLRHDGAPADYRRAIYAYNHADWYVEQVLAQAAEYRHAAQAAPGDATTVPISGGDWLAPVPGGQRCDRRIVPDVEALIRRYHVLVTACYAPAGHAADGEHPLGLAVDLQPGRGGSWDDIDDLARTVGWTRECGASGVAPACPLKPWVRFVGYDGYPNHGRGNHLHISWAHGPGVPAQTVRVFTRP